MRRGILKPEGYTSISLGPINLAFTSPNPCTAKFSTERSPRDELTTKGLRKEYPAKRSSVTTESVMLLENAPLPVTSKFEVSALLELPTPVSFTFL